SLQSGRYDERAWHLAYKLVFEKDPVRNMKVREHRGGLTESMETVIEIPATIAALREHIEKTLAGIADAFSMKLGIITWK
ncbi:hypothetical protein ACXWOE_09875, partial [Streptococcus pyogenes]